MTEREKRIIELFNSGYKAREIANILGINFRTVYYYTKRNNLDFNGSISKYEIYNNKIKELVDKGLGYREIAREINVPRNSVRHICRKYNFTNEFIEMYKTGKCIYERGKNYDRNLNRVKRRKKALENLTVDNDITLKKLYARDNGICAICGEKTNYKDFRLENKQFYAGKNYPSIDHIKPLSKGGLHSWDNVQLAHMICNAIKGTQERKVENDKV